MNFLIVKFSKKLDLGVGVVIIAAKRKMILIFYYKSKA